MSGRNSFTITRFEPQRQTISRFKKTAQLALTVSNNSPCKTSIQLTGAAPTGRCHFEFLPPGESTPLTGQTTLHLDPEESATVPIYLLPHNRPFIGWGRQRCPFTLTCTTITGRYKRRALAAQVCTRPLIGPCLLLVAGIFLATLLFLWGPAFFPASNSILPNQSKEEISSHLLPTNKTRAINPNFGAGGNPGKSTFTPLSATNSGSGKMTYEEMFQIAAARYNLDWRLLSELAYQESRMNPMAIGRDDDMGLMQIIPTTWHRWAPEVGVTDPFDPFSNILVGAAFLAHMRDYALNKGYSDEYWMLVGYNWGPNNLNKLFGQNGNWAQVPNPQRTYALAILQAAYAPARRWEDAPKSPEFH